MKRWQAALELYRPGLELAHRPGWLSQPTLEVSDVLAMREPDRPWLLFIWEPLLTKAPSPSRVQPYCCYISTVIFYHRPYVSVPGKPWRDREGVLHPPSGKVFAQFDQVDARLRWDDIVEFDGDLFKIGGGRVLWHHKRWWMQREARRTARVTEIGAGALR